MAKYNVVVTIDASINVTVEAENEAEALQKGYEAASRPCICNQCADELDIGDVMDAVEATLLEEN